MFVIARAQFTANHHKTCVYAVFILNQGLRPGNEPITMAKCWYRPSITPSTQFSNENCRLSPTHHPPLARCRTRYGNVLKIMHY